MSYRRFKIAAAGSTPAALAAFAALLSVTAPSAASTANAAGHQANFEPLEPQNAASAASRVIAFHGPQASSMSVVDDADGGPDCCVFAAGAPAALAASAA